MHVRTNKPFFLYCMPDKLFIFKRIAFFNLSVIHSDRNRMFYTPQSFNLIFMKSTGALIIIILSFIAISLTWFFDLSKTESVLINIAFYVIVIILYSKKEK